MNEGKTMSRRARTRAAAVAAKHVALVPLAAMTEPDDDEGGIDARDDDPRCYVCGAPKSSTDSGCCGVDGEQYECPRW